MQRLISPWHKWPIALAALTAALNAYAAPQGGNLSAARELEVVAIAGSRLSRLMGRDYSEYSVMAVRDGKIAPIPFQFDDMNVRNFPYVPGGKLPIKGAEGKLDANDKLIFMYKDTGAKITDVARKGMQGRIISEIELSDGVTRGFVYIVSGNPDRSPKRYAHIDKESGLIKTDFWSLQLDPKAPLIWGDFKYKGAGDQTLLDTIKLRARGRLGFVRATIDNSQMPNRLLAVKNGPVRSIAEAEVSMPILGITLADATVDLVVSEHGIQFPVLASIHGAASTLSDVKLEISLDFARLEGAKIRTALGPAEPMIAGRKSDLAKLQKVDVQNNWIAGSSERVELLTLAEVFTPNINPKISVLYKDAAQGDEADKPERFPGSHPQVGYVLSEIPTGRDVDFSVDLYFSKGLWQGDDPTHSVQAIRRGVGAAVTDF
jgi:hypothetical protein